MEDILTAIGAARDEMDACDLYRFMRDTSIAPARRVSFAPQMAFFTMSFGDLMRLVFRRSDPQTEMDVLVNAHCSEDDYHWRWFLEDLGALGLDREVRSSQAYIDLWSDESAPVRRVIYAVLQCAARSSDPLYHLILIEMLEAGVSGFFEYSYKEIASNGLPFLKYFGETHYQAEYEHSLTSWFQTDGKPDVTHPLAHYTPTDDVRRLAHEAISVLFPQLREMYDFWYEKATQVGA